MEKLYYNLSEEEFTKERKVLIWVFAVFFYIAGFYVLFSSIVLHHESIPAVLSVAPFGIGFVVTVFAVFATMKRKDLFFSVDNLTIEFRYGLLNPKKHSFHWSDIHEIIIPHRQRKAQIMFKDGSTYVIDLTWLQKKKSSLIRKHLYNSAVEKNLRIIKVKNL